MRPIWFINAQRLAEYELHFNLPVCCCFIRTQLSSGEDETSIELPSTRWSMEKRKPMWLAKYTLSTTDRNKEKNTQTQVIVIMIQL